ncbi:MAG TPA: dihydropteroate synthase [Streptosporangiaceae bacterium]|nr:dihydropteroate synthase [Streptosporangiaceae bacterium]
MVSRPAGVLRLGRRSFEPSQLLVMAVVDCGSDAAAAMERVHAVVAEGADIVGVAGSPGGEVDEREEIRQSVPFIATVRDIYPELVVGVRTGRREVAREACAAGADLLGSGDGTAPWGFGLAEVAAEFGAGVVCPPGLAARAVAAGVEPERVVIGVERAFRLAGLVATGWPVLVSLPDDDLAQGLATAAVAAWLGARVFRVPWMRETRRVLRMVSAIRGDIPPAYAVRGLA